MFLEKGEIEYLTPKSSHIMFALESPVPKPQSTPQLEGGSSAPEHLATPRSGETHTARINVRIRTVTVAIGWFDIGIQELPRESYVPCCD